MPAAFAVDGELLNARYRDLQNQTHPDRFGNASEAEKLQAVQLNSYVNEAYSTLKSTLLRAGYMLQLNGVDVDAVSQNDLAMDLLMEQMQLREKLAELPKDESALAQLDAMKVDVNERMQQRQDNFAELVAQSEFVGAKKIFHEMQFLTKLLLEIEQGIDTRLGY